MDSSKLGMHQDRSETAAVRERGSPVVTFCLGQMACVFRFGNRENKNKPCPDIVLEPGDVFAFGDDSRMNYHSVVKLISQSYPNPLLEIPGMPDERISISLRETGYSMKSQ
jgi:DNA oxidative demethylase